MELHEETLASLFFGRFLSLRCHMKTVWSFGPGECVGGGGTTPPPTGLSLALQPLIHGQNCCFLVEPSSLFSHPPGFLALPPFLQRCPAPGPAASGVQLKPTGSRTASTRSTTAEGRGGDDANWQLSDRNLWLLQSSHSSSLENRRGAPPPPP